MANLKKHEQYAKCTFSTDKIILDMVREIARQNKVAVSEIITAALIRFIRKNGG